MSVSTMGVSEIERQRLIQRAREKLHEIEQIFVDADSWNDNSRARAEGCDPINPDEDGRLAKMAVEMRDFLARESAREAERLRPYLKAARAALSAPPVVPLTPIPGIDGWWEAVVPAPSEPSIDGQDGMWAEAVCSVCHVNSIDYKVTCAYCQGLAADTRKEPDRG